MLSVISFFGLVALIFFPKYFSSYFSEKGKNLATKEDVEEITDKIEKIRSNYVYESELLEKKKRNS